MHDDSGYFEEILGDGAANMLLVRPDRFCMAVFNRDNAAEKLGSAATMLGIGED